MTDTKYPLIDIGDALGKYLAEHQMTVAEFSRQINTADGIIREFVRHEKPVEKRRIYLILRFLKMLDIPVEDFDPRILRLPEARDVIQAAIADGVIQSNICRYLDVRCAGGSLQSMCDTLKQGLDTCGMTYEAAQKMLKALDDGFAGWCKTEGHRKAERAAPMSKPKPKWDAARYKENRAIRGGRKTRGLHDHDATETPSPEQCEKLLRKWLKDTGHTDGREVGVYDPDKNAIEWDTTTGLYHCTMTWQPYGADFTAVWNSTGAVSVNAQYNSYWGRWFRDGVELSEALSHSKPQRPYSMQRGISHNYGDKPSIATWQDWRKEIDAIRRAIREDT